MPASQLIAFSPVTLGEGIKAGTRRALNVLHTINAVNLSQEAWAALPVGVDGWVDRGFAQIATNSLDGPSTLAVRRSSRETGLILPVQPRATGAHAGPLLAVSVSADDDLTWGLDTRQATAGGIDPILVGLRFLPVDPDGTYSWGYTSGSGGGFSTGLTTKYASIGGTVAFQADPALAAARIPGAFTASRLNVEIAKNNRPSSTVFRSWINGAPGNQIVTVPAGATGRFSAPIDQIDVLAPGDTYAYSATTGAGDGGFNARRISSRLRSTARQWLYACTNVNALTVWAAGGARYVALAGNLANAHPDEALTHVPLFAQRLSKLACYVSANNAPTATILSVRVNGGAGLCAFTIGPREVGWFANDVDSDAIPEGSVANLEILPGGGSGKVIFRSVTLLGETVAA